MVEKSRYLTPKGNTNDWLKPIGESAKVVFSRFSRGEALEIAGALVRGIYGIEKNEIPWTIIFPSDDFGLVLEKLKTVLKTPDGETPTNNPKYFDPMKNLRKILFDARAADFPFYDHAACSLIEVAAGRAEGWYFYDDLSRKYPQYVRDWEEKLIGQFGEEAVFQAIQNKNELFDLLKQNEEIALLHESPSLQKEGEDGATFVKRAWSSLNIADVGIEAASKLLDIRLSGYRKATYRLRNISLPVEK